MNRNESFGTETWFQSKWQGCLLDSFVILIFYRNLIKKPMRSKSGSESINNFWIKKKKVICWFCYYCSNSLHYDSIHLGMRFQTIKIVTKQTPFLILDFDWNRLFSSMHTVLAIRIWSFLFFFWFPNYENIPLRLFVFSPLLIVRDLFVNIGDLFATLWFCSFVRIELLRILLILLNGIDDDLFLEKQ